MKPPPQGSNLALPLRAFCKNYVAVLPVIASGAVPRCVYPLAVYG